MKTPGRFRSAAQKGVMALLLGGLSSTAAWGGELGIRLTILPQAPLASMPLWPGLQPLRVDADGRGFYSVPGTAFEALQWLRAQALEKDLTVGVLTQHDAGWEGWL